MLEDALIEKINYLKLLGVNFNRQSIIKLYETIDVEDVDEKYAKEVVGYYKDMGWSSADPWVHILIDQKIGVRSKYFLPGYQYRAIQKVFNDPEKTRAYTDKNTYDVLVRTDRQPKIFLKCVSGKFFNGKNEGVNPNDEARRLSGDLEYIIKPSRTANGKGVSLCQFHGDKIVIKGKGYCPEELIRKLSGNFIVQERLKQSKVVSQIHENSVNTLRMLTFRWKGELHYLLSFLRVGAGGAINDNAGTGGICIGVNEEGVLNDYGVTEKCEILKAHPTTGYSFEKRTVIPNFDKFKSFVLELHKDILHHDLVSWDIAVGEDDMPIFIEHNFAGMMWIYQMATGKPIFGELSDEVIKFSSKMVSAPQKKKPKKTNKKISRIVLIQGEVQGVGYRKWLRRSAKSLGLSGWVRNRSDGTVQALLSGDGVSVMKQIDGLWTGPSRSKVNSVTIKRFDKKARPGFRILSDRIIARKSFLQRVKEGLKKPHRQAVLK